jgi:hypothetical protein
MQAQVTQTPEPQGCASHNHQAQQDPMSDRGLILRPLDME